MASFYSDTNTSLIRHWQEPCGLGIRDWTYGPKWEVGCEMRKQPIDVGYVISEIALLSPDGRPFRVREKTLLRGLQQRFRATLQEAQEALRLALLFGSIRRAPAGWIRIR